MDKLEFMFEEFRAETIQSATNELFTEWGVVEFLDKWKGRLITFLD